MIAVKYKVETSIEEVWKFWATPEHISKWNKDFGDWHILC